jgi:hypothetical protein
LIGWLNENEGAIVGLGTVCLVLVTAVYVWLTARILNVTRASLVGAQLTIIGISDQGVVGYGDRGEVHTVHLLVANSGAGPAFGFKPRLRLGPRWPRKGLELEHDEGYAPDVISGTAQAMEPTAEPVGAQQTSSGGIVIRGSRLEDAFCFMGSAGWEPSPDPVRIEACVRWTDGVGRHKTTRIIHAPLRGMDVFS